MTLPPITPKQQEIIRLLYTYRFLDRTQIQILLNHKDKRRIISWLKDLRDKDYITWIYDPNNFIEKTRPAVYYISLNGIRYLRTLEQYPAEELRKRYKDANRQQDFIARSLLLANCCINFKAKSSNNVEYSWLTQADYADHDNELRFLSELGPHLFVSKRGGETTINYFMEVFDASLPRYRLKHRLKVYVEYLASGEWEAETNDDVPPVTLMVCPTIAELIYTKRRVRKLLEDIGDGEGVQIRVTTMEMLKAGGATGKVWEDL